MRKNLNVACIDESDISSNRKISGPVVSRLTHWLANSSTQQSQVKERCSVHVILSLLYCLRYFKISEEDNKLEIYSAFTETGATQTMKTNQKAELKQEIPTFSNPANQMPSTKQ